ncbi:hypothetical protein ISCGN_015422 [Ixodes scapularis]
MTLMLCFCVSQAILVFFLLWSLPWASASTGISVPLIPSSECNSHVCLFSCFTLDRPSRMLPIFGTTASTAATSVPAPPLNSLLREPYSSGLGNSGDDMTLMLCFCVSQAILAFFLLWSLPWASASTGISVPLIPSSECNSHVCLFSCFTLDRPSRMLPIFGTTASTAATSVPAPPLNSLLREPYSSGLGNSGDDMTLMLCFCVSQAILAFFLLWSLPWASASTGISVPLIPSSECNSHVCLFSCFTLDRPSRMLPIFGTTASTAATSVPAPPLNSLLREPYSSGLGNSGDDMTLMLCFCVSQAILAFFLLWSLPWASASTGISVPLIPSSECNSHVCLFSCFTLDRPSRMLPIFGTTASTAATSVPAPPLNSLLREPYSSDPGVFPALVVTLGFCFDRHFGSADTIVGVQQPRVPLQLFHLGSAVSDAPNFRHNGVNSSDISSRTPLKQLATRTLLQWAREQWRRHDSHAVFLRFAGDPGVFPALVVTLGFCFDRHFGSADTIVGVQQPRVPLQLFHLGSAVSDAPNFRHNGVNSSDISSRTPLKQLATRTLLQWAREQWRRHDSHAVFLRFAGDPGVFPALVVTLGFCFDRHFGSADTIVGVQQPRVPLQLFHLGSAVSDAPNFRHNGVNSSDISSRTPLKQLATRTLLQWAREQWRRHDSHAVFLRFAGDPGVFPALVVTLGFCFDRHFGSADTIVGVQQPRVPLQLFHLGSAVSDAPNFRHNGVNSSDISSRTPLKQLATRTLLQWAREQWRRHDSHAVFLRFAGDPGVFPALVVTLGFCFDRHFGSADTIVGVQQPRVPLQLFHLGSAVSDAPNFRHNGVNSSDISSRTPLKQLATRTLLQWAREQWRRHDSHAVFLRFAGDPGVFPALVVTLGFCFDRHFGSADTIVGVQQPRVPLQLFHLGSAVSDAPNFRHNGVNSSDISSRTPLKQLATRTLLQWAREQWRRHDSHAVFLRFAGDPGVFPALVVTLGFCFDRHFGSADTIVGVQQPRVPLQLFHLGSAVSDAPNFRHNGVNSSDISDPGVFPALVVTLGFCFDRHFGSADTIVGVQQPRVPLQLFHLGSAVSDAPNFRHNGVNSSDISSRTPLKQLATRTLLQWAREQWRRHDSHAVFLRFAGDPGVFPALVVTLGFCFDRHFGSADTIVGVQQPRVPLQLFHLGSAVSDAPNFRHNGVNSSDISSRTPLKQLATRTLLQWAREQWRRHDSHAVFLRFAGDPGVFPALVVTLGFCFDRHLGSADTIVGVQQPRVPLQLFHLGSAVSDAPNFRHNGVNSSDISSRTPLKQLATRTLLQWAREQWRRHDSHAVFLRFAGDPGVFPALVVTLGFCFDRHFGSADTIVGVQQPRVPLQLFHLGSAVSDAPNFRHNGVNSSDISSRTPLKQLATRTLLQWAREQWRRHDSHAVFLRFAGDPGVFPALVVTLGFCFDRHFGSADTIVGVQQPRVPLQLFHLGSAVSDAPNFRHNGVNSSDISSRTPLKQLATRTLLQWAREQWRRHDSHAVFLRFAGDPGVFPALVVTLGFCFDRHFGSADTIVGVQQPRVPLQLFHLGSAVSDAPNFRHNGVNSSDISSRTPLKQLATRTLLQWAREQWRRHDSHAVFLRFAGDPGVFPALVVTLGFCFDRHFGSADTIVGVQQPRVPLQLFHLGSAVSDAPNFRHNGVNSSDISSRTPLKQLATRTLLQWAREQWRRHDSHAVFLRFAGDPGVFPALVVTLGFCFDRHFGSADTIVGVQQPRVPLQLFHLGSAVSDAPNFRHNGVNSSDISSRTPLKQLATRTLLQWAREQWRHMTLMLCFCVSQAILAFFLLWSLPWASASTGISVPLIPSSECNSHVCLFSCFTLDRPSRMLPIFGTTASTAATSVPAPPLNSLLREPCSSGLGNSGDDMTLMLCFCVSQAILAFFLLWSLPWASASTGISVPLIPSSECNSHVCLFSCFTLDRPSRMLPIFGTTASTAATSVPAPPLNSLLREPCSSGLGNSGDDMTLMLCFCVSQAILAFFLLWSLPWASASTGISVPLIPSSECNSHVCLFSCFTSDRPSRMLPIFGTTASTAATSVPAPPLNSLLREPCSSGLGNSGDDMTLMLCFCVSQAILAFFLLWSLRWASASTGISVPLIPSSECNSHVCLFSCFTLDRPSRMLPIFGTTASTAATSVPAPPLNSLLREPYSSGLGNSGDDMTLMLCFCVSQAILAFFLLWSLPWASASTGISVPLIPSSECNSHVCLFSCFTLDRPSRMLPIFGTTASTTATSVPAPPLNSLLREPCSSGLGNSGDDMTLMLCFCVSQAILAFFLLWSLPWASASTGISVPLIPSSECNSHVCLFSCFTLDRPSRMLPIFGTTASTAATSVPAPPLNSLLREPYSSGLGSSGDDMTLMLCFCVSQAILAFFLLWSLPWASASTGISVPLIPSSECNSHVCLFSCFTLDRPSRMLPIFGTTASTAATSVPAPPLNSLLREPYSSGLGSSGDDMTLMLCFCVSQAILAFFLLWSLPWASASTGISVPLIPSSECNSHVCLFSCFTLDRPSRMLPIFGTTASTAATSVPAPPLNSLLREPYSSGLGSSGDDMTLMLCFCVSQAILAIFLLWSLPWASASTGISVPLIPSSECNSHVCLFSCFTLDRPSRMLPIFGTTASTAATSVPAPPLNSLLREPYSSGLGSSGDDMTLMLCFCVSQAILVFFLLWSLPWASASTGISVPLIPSSECNSHVCLFSCFTLDRPSRMLPIFGTTASTAATSVPAPPLNSLLREPYSSGLGSSGDDMTLMLCFCVSQAILVFFLLWSLPWASASTGISVPLIPSSECNSHVCLFSCFTLDRPSRMLPIFGTTASTAATSVPAPPLNSLLREPYSSGLGSSGDDMTLMLCFCVSQAILAFFLLWSLPWASASTGISVPLIPSSECSSHVCLFSCFTLDRPSRMLPIFGTTASTTATSVPAPPLNSLLREPYSSGLGSSGDDMTLMLCFCVSQAILAFFLLSSLPSASASTGISVPLIPSSECSSHVCLFSCFTLDRPSRMFPIFGTTASTTATSVPAPPLNSLLREPYSSNPGVFPALVFALSFCFDRHLGSLIPSSECSSHVCLFSCFTLDRPSRMLPIFGTTASTTATSVPAPPLNSLLREPYSSGLGSSGDDMTLMLCFCVSQVPLIPSSECSSHVCLFSCFPLDQPSRILSIFGTTASTTATSVPAPPLNSLLREPYSSGLGSRVQAVAFRQLQTRTYPNPAQYHRMFPEIYTTNTCKVCRKEVATLTHMLWDCAKDPHGANSGTLPPRLSAALCSPSLDVQLWAVQQACEAVKRQDFDAPRRAKRTSGNAPKRVT